MCCLSDYFLYVCDAKKHYKLQILSKRSVFIEKSVISHIKNDMKAMKLPIYIICHLCFFNQVRMAYFLHYGRFYGPQKNTMIRLSTATDTTVKAIVL